MFKNVLSVITAVLLISQTAFAAVDYSGSRGYFRNNTVTDISPAGAYVDVAHGYAVDNDEVNVYIKVTNSGDTASAGNIEVYRQGGTNLTKVTTDFDLQHRCVGDGTYPTYTDASGSWTDFNTSGTKLNLGSIASGNFCQVKYQVKVGTSNDFDNVSNDIIYVYDNGSLVKTLSMNLYVPFFELSEARDKGTSGDEIVIQFSEDVYIDETNPTTDSESAANPNNFDVNVNSGGATAFSGTASYSSSSNELTLTPSTNLFSTGDTVQVTLKNLKTDYGRYLNTADYTTASTTGLTTETVTAIDKEAPTVTNALYDSGAGTVEIVFSEAMLTSFAESDITVTNGDFDTPTMSWPTITGYSANQVLRLTLGSSPTVTADTTEIHFDPTSAVKDTAGNETSNDTNSKVTVTAGGLSQPSVTAFAVADNSDNSITGYTDNQTIAITTYTVNSLGAGTTYEVTESGTTPNSGDFGAQPSTYTLSGFVDGTTYTIYPWVRDSNGTSTTSNADTRKVTITVDTTAPTITLTDDAGGVATDLDTIAVSVSDSGVGVGETRYVVRSDNTCDNSIDTDLDSGTASTSFSANDESHNNKYVCFRSTDSLGNASYQVSSEITNIDTTAPTITSVTSTTADGTYGAGQVINITVNFSEAITSSGNVTVTLETGVTDRTCTFSASSATSASCNYTVQSGDESSDLTVSSISGTISDAASNAMTNFTPTTNLAASSAIVISAPASSGGGGGGGGGGSSGPDTKTTYTLPTSFSDKDVELVRPVATRDGIFTRKVTIKEYFFESTFIVEQGTEVTDLDGEPYTEEIDPIYKEKYTKIEGLDKPSGTLVYSSFFKVAGERLLYSNPLDIVVKFPAALKNYTDQYNTYKIMYWVPNSRLTSFTPRLVASTQDPQVSDGEWRELGGPELVEDGSISFSVDHSTYVAFVLDSSNTTKPDENTGTGGGGETEATDSQKEAALDALSDIQGHWAENYIVDLYTKGVVKGKGDTGMFFPNDTINRAAFLKMVLELFDYKVASVSSVENPFVDVSSDAWFAPYVLTAYKEGIVKGYELEAAKDFEEVTQVYLGDFSPAVMNLQNILYEMGYLPVNPTGYFGPVTTQAVQRYQQANGISATGFVGEVTQASLNSEDIVANALIKGATLEFRPGTNINRAEALILMFKAAGIEVPDVTTDEFDDVPSGVWFEKYVAYAKENGVVSGKGERRFAPGENITRAEAVKVALNVFNLK